MSEEETFGPLEWTRAEMMCEAVHSILCPLGDGHVAGQCQPTEKVLAIFSTYLYEMEYIK